MDRLHGQRGYTRLSKLILLAIVVAAVYLGFTFWKPAYTWYRIKNDAKRLANRSLQMDANQEHLVDQFIKTLYERDGLVISRAELTLDDADSDRIDVSVRLELPYEYPWIGKGGLWKTTVEVFAERSRGF